MIDQLLQRIGYKYEDLSSDERQTLMGWMENLSKQQMTVERVKDHIKAMRDSVEQELTKTDHNSKQDLFLKARLRNYMLLEAFLTSPERAKQAMERALAGIASKK